MNHFAFAFMVTLGSCFYVTDDLRLYAYVLWVSAMGLLSLSLLLGKGAFLSDKVSFFLLFCFQSFAFLSSFKSGSVDLFLGAFFVFYLYVLMSTSWGRGDDILSRFAGCVHGVIAAEALFILYSLVLFPPTLDGSYAGAFYNPNALGGVVSSFIAITVALSLGYLLGGSYKKGLFFCGISLLLFGIVLASRSRASVGASFASFVLFIFFYFFSIFARGKLNVYRLLFLFLSGAVSISLAIFFWDFIQYGFFEKMQRKAESGDVTDGRFEVWQYVLSNMDIFGHGRSAFEGLEHGAHSTYISLLAQYGWLTAASFFLFCFYKLNVYGFFSIRASLDRANKYAFVPFFSIVAFVLLSLFEGMMLKVAMFSFVMFSAIPIRFLGFGASDYLEKR